MTNETRLEVERDGKIYTHIVKPGQLGYGLTISTQIDGNPAYGVELSQIQIQALLNHLASSVSVSTKH